jgi:hypothetical protein
MNETEETGVAFRAGVKGLPFISTVGPQPDIDVQCDMAQGPNEQYFVVRLSDERIPGLSDPVAAYETGRALRWIGFELDKMKIPAAKGAGAFIPRLAEAVLYFKLRNERQPWGAADTAYIFAEILVDSGTPKPLAVEVERAVIRYAKQRPVVGRRLPMATR